MNQFQVGMAKQDITPPLGANLFGYPYRRQAQKVSDQLSVKAIAIRQQEESVILISSEVCMVDRDTCEQIAEQIALETGIKKENIMYAAIHTHSGPNTFSQPGWGDTDHTYLDSVLIPRSVQAAKDAIACLQPAVMGIGTAESLAGINRREISKTGNVILGQNPEGPYDPIITAIVFRSVSGNTIGSILHFAVHPTCAGGNLAISRDWPGWMIDKVEEITGAECMYINGAEGDVGPRLSNGMTTGDDTSIEEIGRIAAEDAKKAVESICEFKVPQLKLQTGTIRLPFIEMPSKAYIQRELEALGDPDLLADVDILKYARLKKMEKMYEAEAAIPTCMELCQTVVSLDELALVPFPFETFCKIALSLQEESPYQRTLLLGLTNGALGYLPTEEQLPYGGYEVDSFRASTIPGFIDGLDKQIVHENVRLLEELYRK